MDISEFQKINAERAKRWHKGDLNQWSLLEWAGAMCGEAGEAANIAKKIKRIEIGLSNKETGIDRRDEAALKIKMAMEIGDTIVYGLIVLSLLGQDASGILAYVFNKKSEEYGFPERAPS
jgi:NTP pyrophosphatase (non-canonical NTP hydrolase)